MTNLTANLSKWSNVWLPGKFDQGILKGEVSLYSWPPVWPVWVSLFCKIRTKIVSCHTADSKPVKQEVNGTVILPPLVFPDSINVKKKFYRIKCRPSQSFRVNARSLKMGLRTLAKFLWPQIQNSGAQFNNQFYDCSWGPRPNVIKLFV